jgi:hypothetical protein
MVSPDGPPPPVSNPITGTWRNSFADKDQKGRDLQKFDRVEELICDHLLLTAVVLVKDCHEKYHQCRALLDAGSQSNFITRHLTNKQKLKTIPITHKIIGINTQPSNVRKSVNINIKSICSDYGSNLNCLVLSKITGNLSLTSFSKKSLRIPEHLELADKAFNVNGSIDLLLGTGLFLSLLKDGQIPLQHGHLRLQNTHLGWVFGGPLHLQGFWETSLFE